MDLPGGTTFNPQPSDGTLKHWWSVLFSRAVDDTAQNADGEARFALLMLNNVGTWHFVRKVGPNWYQSAVFSATEKEEIVASTWLTWVGMYKHPPTEGVKA